MDAFSRSVHSAGSQTVCARTDTCCVHEEDFQHHGQHRCMRLLNRTVNTLSPVHNTLIWKAQMGTSTLGQEGGRQEMC